MAQVVKPASTGALTPLPGGRQPAGTRSVATVESAPIEGVNPPGGISYEDSAFLFQDYSQGRRSHDRNQGPVRNPQTRGVNTPSQMFAAIFEINQVTNAGGTSGVSGTTIGAGLLSRAIDIYESNTKAIAGNEAVRGSTISVNL
ncbi:MAG: hypothetical protein QGF38_08860 [Rhodospirillales bacterium]|nr:hypothetical protein [Rhodospirillales bacterium]MDP7651799.1 hypothetical protein [Rhodospirillales bacterium]